MSAQHEPQVSHAVKISDSELSDREVYRLMDEHKKSSRDACLQEFVEHHLDVLTAMGLEKKADRHWVIMVEGLACQYWPSVCKWHYNGKTFHGNPVKFKHWLKRRLSWQEHSSSL